VNNLDRKRRNVVIGADLLESRTLLNAHLPHSSIAHVTSIHTDAKALKPITGTLTGELGGGGFLPNSHSFLAFWSATGSSTVGPVSVEATGLGTTVFTSNAGIAKVSYTNGSGTLRPSL
jgi:hypothetical protein